VAGVGIETPAVYPPERHLLRDLRLTVEHGATGTSEARLEIVDALRTDLGTVRLGALATVVDIVGGGLSALAVAPDWIATSDLTLHIARPSRADALVARGRVLRKGTTTVVLEVDLLDDTAAAPFGFATLGFTVLPRRAGVNPVIDRRSAGRMALALPDSGFTAPLLETVGVTVLDAAAGAVSIPMQPYVQNSFRALQGGMIGLLADVSAEHALRAATGAPFTPLDLQLTYLELGKVGPFRTTARVDEVAERHGAARVTVHDDGRAGARMAIARVRAGVPT
jgi:acyl-coenzyme A thioesterase PaaI-like protein